jgi:hypothetical protein
MRRERSRRLALILAIGTCFAAETSARADIFSLTSNIPITTDGQAQTPGWPQFYWWTAGNFTGSTATSLALAWEDNGLIVIDVLTPQFNDGFYSPTSFDDNRWWFPTGGHGWPQNFFWVPGDFNDDGVTDLTMLWEDNGGIETSVFLSSTGSFDNPAWSSGGGAWLDQGVFVAGNFDGQGGDDIAYVFDDGGGISIDVHASNGTNGFGIQRVATQQGSWIDQSWPYFTWGAGDVDGNGQADLVLAFNDNGGIDLDAHLLGGSGGTLEASLSRWATGQGSYFQPNFTMVPTISASIFGPAYGGAPSMMYAFDSGGFVGLDAHITTGSSFRGTRVYTGDTYHGGVGQFLGGDFNGDGLGDVAYVWNNNGNIAIDLFLGNCDGPVTTGSVCCPVFNSNGDFSSLCDNDTQCC